MRLREGDNKILLLLLQVLHVREASSGSRDPVWLNNSDSLSILPAMKFIQLIGPPGSGKTLFRMKAFPNARRVNMTSFWDDEIVNSDHLYFEEMWDSLKLEAYLLPVTVAHLRYRPSIDVPTHNKILIYEGYEALYYTSEVIRFGD